ncbi:MULTISPECIES: amidohydrolase family protein [unclassified Nocardia]|uniref:amidohydrolase family protein n=1 Tax=unclassified Nocardia TaxID=2637762 RepID=UPI001CE41907|nr:MULTISPECIES: amidohydrolase family protein [unclassified Nocardia]
MPKRLFTAGTVWSGADCLPHTGWLLVGDGRIERVGRSDEPAPAADEVVDLAGRHVLPGFIDTHSHLSVAALVRDGIDGAAWHSVASALAAIGAAAAGRPELPWLLCWNTTPHEWPESRLPTAAELDAVAPGRRVLVSGVDLHRGAASSAALEGFSPRSKDGDIGRGRRTGEVWEAAYGAILQRALRELEFYRRDAGAELLAAEARRQLACGITHAHDPFVPPAGQPALLRLVGRTPLRLSWATGSPAGILNPPGDPASAPDGPYGAAGREVKIFLDGADRCALELPMRAVPGLVAGTVREALRHRGCGPVREGMRQAVRMRAGRVRMPYLRYTDAELRETLAAYATSGFRIRLHALGNLAATQAALALRAVGVPAGTATVDHLTVLDRRTADLVAAGGAYAAVQPGFLPRFGPQFVRLGIDRHRAIVGARMLAAAGAPVVLSSDHPCGPLDPLGNLRTAVGRRGRDGAVVQADQALAPAAAVRAATVTAAASLGISDRGALSPGQAADLVVCDGDPFDPATRVTQTWVAGEKVWQERNSA